MQNHLGVIEQIVREVCKEIGLDYANVWITKSPTISIEILGKSYPIHPEEQSSNTLKEKIKIFLLTR